MAEEFSVIEIGLFNDVVFDEDEDIYTYVPYTEEMPPVHVLSKFLVVKFRCSTKAFGAEIIVNRSGPDNLSLPAYPYSIAIRPRDITFGAEGNTATIHYHIKLIDPSAGRYWFEVFVDGDSMGKVPLDVHQ